MCWMSTANTYTINVYCWTAPALHLRRRDASHWQHACKPQYKHLTWHRQVVVDPQAANGVRDMQGQTKRLALWSNDETYGERSRLGSEFDRLFGKGAAGADRVCTSRTPRTHQVGQERDGPHPLHNAIVLTRPLYTSCLHSERSHARDPRFSSSHTS